MAGIEALPPDLASEATGTDASSHAASMSSTPPTSISPDNISLASDLSKVDNGHLELQTDSPDVHEPSQATAARLTAMMRTPRDDSANDHIVRDQARKQLPDHALSISRPEPNHGESSTSEDPSTPTAAAIVVARSPSPARDPAPATASPARPRRAGIAAPVYNIAKLVGTDIHGKRASKGDDISKRRRRTKAVSDAYKAAIAAGATAEAAEEASAKVAAEHHAASAASSAKSTPRVKVRSVKRSTPRSSPVVLAFAKALKPSSVSPGAKRSWKDISSASGKAVATKLSTLGKRDRKSFESESGGSRMSRELRRLQDTNEFAHIDERPVLHTVWSKGKYIEVDDDDEPIRTPPRKKTKLSSSSSPKKEETPNKKEVTFASDEPKKKVPKKWLERGLYAGQVAHEDITKFLNALEKKKLADHPELLPWKATSKALPLPLFNGFRMLLTGRDFKLPFDICNPLPPGQPKPPAYRTMTKSE
jgi:[histone H3]-lysine4 N-trimethyltransferase ASH1L